MTKLNPDKVSKLHNANELLERKYGKRGTPGREAFDSRALAYYFGEILKDKRKELKLTQQQLADKVGKERSYIARIEKGQTDIQLSSLLQLSNALGLKFSLS